VILDGITVQDVAAWLRSQDGGHNIIRNSTFLRATSSGTRAGLKFVNSDYNVVFNNHIEDGNDNLSLIDSDYNIVDGNFMRVARHNLWAILCGNFNIIRNNDFHNQTQKMGQITDCEGVPSDAPVKYNATKRNVVENNIFRYTASAGSSSPYAGIQYAGQQGIIRQNAFFDSIGPALQMTLYSSEAQYNTDNRVYHNVMYATHHAGVDIDPSGGTMSGNVFKNNILYKSVMTGYASSLEGQPIQVLAGQLQGYQFDTNNIFGTAAGQQFTITNGNRTGTSGAQNNLAGWQQSYPQLFVRNVEVNPLFVSEGARDFHLQSASPMIDAGTFLTRTAGAGSGTSLVVTDASYFMDGFGIPGEVGDMVQLQGQSQAARVVRVDYATNTLTLDRSLSWAAGVGVGLPYGGTAPDLGMYESGGGVIITPPRAPTNVRIIR
jgi:hypothetical protein